MPPDARHWLGTDDQGRDIFWRLIAGAQLSLFSTIIVVALYSTIGMIVATLATVGPRWVDELLMRITDIGLSLPGLVVALGIATVLGPSLQSGIIALALTGWPMTARILRTTMRQTMEQPYVEGARILGVSPLRLMLKHVLPTSLDVLIVKWAGDISFTMLILAGLSFIGVGAQPPSPEWGCDDLRCTQLHVDRLVGRGRARRRHRHQRRRLRAARRHPAGAPRPSLQA